MLARSCLSISCFLSVLQNFDKKVWTGGQVMKILKKVVSASFIFLFESVDMSTRRCLSTSCFSLCYVPFTSLTKSVDRWTSNENSEKKILISFILLLESVHMWTRYCLSISFFLSTLYPSKFWQKSVDRWTSNEKN